MKIIGITGGIGSGKSTVSAYLKSKGFFIIDADKIGKEVVERNSKILDMLVKEFGREILFQDATLDRKKLGAIVFSDAKKKAKLDGIMHAAIFKCIDDQLETIKHCENPKVVFVDAPLLFETKLHETMDSTWVIDAEDEIRKERVVLRDGLSRAEVENRIKNQMPRQEKNQLADLVIDNGKDVPYLHMQIDFALQKIKE